MTKENAIYEPLTPAFHANASIDQLLEMLEIYARTGARLPLCSDITRLQLAEKIALIEREMVRLRASIKARALGLPKAAWTYGGPR